MGYTFKKKSESPFGTIEAGAKLFKTYLGNYKVNYKLHDGSEWQQEYSEEFVKDPANSEWFEYDGIPDVGIKVTEQNRNVFRIEISGFEGSVLDLETMIRNTITTFIHEKKASQPAES